MLRFEQFAPDETDLLSQWLTSDTWHYFVNPSPTPAQVREWIADGVFASDETRTLWIRTPDGKEVGLIRLHDLHDPTPMFDIRILAPFRGRGYGKQALLWLTDHLFTTMPDIRRIEGQTREDNVPMRRLFRACGYVKEAHYRESWPAGDGRWLASVAYARLRREWEQGISTPVNWHDEP